MSQPLMSETRYEATVFTKFPTKKFTCLKKSFSIFVVKNLSINLTMVYFWSLWNASFSWDPSNWIFFKKKMVLVAELGGMRERHSPKCQCLLRKEGRRAFNESQSALVKMFFNSHSIITAKTCYFYAILNKKFLQNLRKLALRKSWGILLRSQKASQPPATLTYTISKYVCLYLTDDKGTYY